MSDLTIDFIIAGLLTVVGVLGVIGAHAIAVGTVKTSFKCVTFSDVTGLCTKQVLLHEGKVYNLTLKDK